MASSPLSGARCTSSCLCRHGAWSPSSLRLRSQDLGGRLLIVNKAFPGGERPECPPRSFEQAFRIYVGNLSWDVDNGCLEQIFSEYGKVVNARAAYDRKIEQSCGFGFVTITDDIEMNDAIAALDGQSLDGREIRVNVAEDIPKRSF
ncbi:hypothetical protein HN51_055534 [Arachis hypogaea]